MTETFNYKQIKDEYGIEAIQKIRTFESISKKKGRYVSHLRFYMHCKHGDVVPKGIKIKAQMKGNEARKIIEKAERALLNIRIGEVARKNKILDKRKEDAEKELERILPENIKSKIREINEERQERELKKSSEVQKKKYKRLIDHKEQEPEQIESIESTENQTSLAERTFERNENNNNNNNDMLRENTDETEFQDGGRSNDEVENEEVGENEENEENDQNNESPIEEEHEQRGEEIEEDIREERIDQLGEENAEEELDETIPYAEEEHEPKNIIENIKDRWVKNISSRPLTKDEINLLRKGGGFAVSPNEIPHSEYITATEQACQNLAKGEAICLRVEIVEELEKAKVPRSNLTPAERKAMKDLQNDEDIMILPADKGKCLVVMDRKQYIEKMEEKLSDETTYKKIKKDPTNEIKEGLTKILNEIKEEGQLDHRTYFRLTPTKTRIPRMYGLPKIHKANYPLREIVDSTSSVAKECDKYIAQILQKYTGKTPYYVKNSAHFAQKIKDLTVEDDETLVSYDVEALYPSVPQSESIDIIHQLMTADTELDKKTTMSAENVIRLFRQCVHTTYFAFNKELYKQVDGLAIGASSSGPTAELFMEKLEVRAITTFIEPPKIWMRYVVLFRN